MYEEIEIRTFQEADRQEVFRIAADSAFFGKPVEAFLDDRQLFCDAFVRYYSDFEAKYFWVACKRNVVVGYLSGCVDTAIQRKRHWLHTILPVAQRAFQGRYKIGKKTWRFTLSLIGGVMRNEFIRINNRDYPAHLHLNVEETNRGYGLGQKLMKAFLIQIEELRIPGVFLGTTNLNEAACRLYEKTGFELLERRKTQVWRYLIGRSVENRCYGLKLSAR